ncbi:hypothetical protein AA106555_0675 [Neokomagataea thailandica NBRC 106555]|uniref:Flagellar assembly protein FliH n=2 Tax=Neokomagataea TaxID=1223423 RepID=A0A4Y6V3L9_9PROT|nr:MULTISPECIES: hypothetical protein [Neokomagataea]QDH24533.1 hypothetical protein D5366_03965 [Neokomagataea tanensis]GBR51761.1 hypothetical protein AA106555_0675 [Neokomagataea thailandica NBRC 106555]
MQPSAYASLFSEDFDVGEVVQLSDLSDVEHDDAVVQEARLTEADCALARQEGFEDGIKFGREAAAAEYTLQRNTFEHSLQACLASMQAQIDAHLAQESERVSGVIVGMMTRLFPSLLEGFGAAERALVMQKLLPLLKHVPDIKCLVPTGDGQILQDLCQKQGVSFIRCVESDALAPGDFEVDWTTGKAVRDAQSVMQVFQEILTSKTEDLRS